MIDNIFSKQQIDKFAFDSKVATVFDNMIARSVPGYTNITDMCAIIVNAFANDNAVCIDFGCSTATTLKAIEQANTDKNLQLLGIDSSEAMLQQAQLQLPKASNIKLSCADINNWQPPAMDFAFCNFTLQFIAIANRHQILTRLFQKLNTNGVLILSEKVSSSQQNIDLYHQFKQSNGYSKSEVARKRQALENVLIPEAEQSHIQRLTDIGFINVECWFRCFNFISIIAFKPK